MKNLIPFVFALIAFNSFAFEEMEKVVVTKNSVGAIDVAKECVHGSYSFKTKIIYTVSVMVNSSQAIHKFMSDDEYNNDTYNCDAVKDQASSKAMNDFLRDLDDVNADNIQVITAKDTLKCYHDTMSFVVNKTSRRVENVMSSYTLVPCP